METYVDDEGKSYCCHPEDLVPGTTGKICCDGETDVITNDKTTCCDDK